jgi:hypothetical protein
VLDDRRELVFLQARPRLLMQRLDAGVGDRRRFAQPLELEVGLAARDVFDDVFRVDGLLPKRFDDVIVQSGVHPVAADEADLAGEMRQ